MDPVLLQSLLAAFIGTGAMTISSETEATLAERESSSAPGKALSRVLRVFGVGPLEGKRLAVASTWGHWLYGTAWGVLLWALADPQLAALNIWLAGVVFFFAVWIAAQIVTPALAGSKPSVAYGAKATLTEGWHHLVYAAAATASLAGMAWASGALI